MIKRAGLKGIDNELSKSLVFGLNAIEERMLFHIHNDWFHELLKILQGLSNDNSSAYCLSFQRYDDRISLEVSANSLDITYEGLTPDTLIESTYMIYSYTYNNNSDEIPTVEEDGDIFIFSEKFSEHLICMDIDTITIKKTSIND